jgi:virginiamycin B lyase
MTRSTLVATLLGILAAIAATTVVPLSNAQRANTLTSRAKCKFVTRKIDGKKKRVRVCKKSPAPKPQLPEAGTVAATIPIDARVNSVTVADNSVWVVTDDQRLVRVDPATNAIAATIALPEQSEWPEDNVAYGHGSLWVPVASPDTVNQPEFDGLLRIDPAANKIVARIHVGHSPEGIAITQNTVWTANHRADWTSGAPAATGKYYISRVDPSSNTETARVLVEVRPTKGDSHGYWCCGPSSITTAAGALWLTDPQEVGSGTVIRVDPATNAVTARISFENSKAVACGQIVGDDAAIWVESSCDNTYVARINPQTNTITAAIDTGNPTTGIALGFGSVWVTAAGPFGVTGLNRIDPATNKIVARTKLVLPSAIATGLGSVWVGSNKKLLRIAPR